MSTGEEFFLNPILLQHLHSSCDINKTVRREQSYQDFFETSFDEEDSPNDLSGETTNEKCRNFVKKKKKFWISATEISIVLPGRPISF